MKRVFGLTICLLFLSVTTNLAQKRAVKRTKSKTISGKKIKKFQTQERREDFYCDLPASVTALFLDKSEITLNCPISNENCSSNKTINFKTVAVDTGQEKYVYTISAGKIIGEGADVEWDLSGVKPGIYTITAGISFPLKDNKTWGIWGMTQTKVVTIK